MIKYIAVFVLLVLVLSACAGTNPSVNIPDEDGEVDGFWQGLLHGIISPITFIISLVNDDVSFYEVHNNGNWYDFGFVFGAGILSRFNLPKRRR